MPALNILKTYNCRTESGTVRRGRTLDDWERYGICYAKPSVLPLHDFSAWGTLVFDYAALEQGVDPTDYPGTDVYLYIAFGGRYARAAREGGYEPPEGNVAALAALRLEIHAEIDQVMAAGFAGVFHDEVDVGYWDPSMSIESATIMKTQFQEYCDYIRLWGGKSFVNGVPWFADCGELFLLESFLASWSSNIFMPEWSQLNFFTRYGFSLDELGVNAGIPWSTGILPWLYLKKYAPDVEIYAHSYGDPESIWQHDKQKFSLAGSLALGLTSWNYIEPTNQTLIPLWAHSFYAGAPLQCPQIDTVNKTASRKYTGADVSFSEAASEGVIDMNVSPDYWWEIDQDFEDINWAVDSTPITGTNRTAGFIPDYLEMSGIDIYDDRDEVYFRITTVGTFPEADVIPLFFYIQLDPARGGYQTATNPAGEPFRHFHDMKAQLYLFGKSLFRWDHSTNDWVYLYQVRYDTVGNYIYYAIRKETLRYAEPGWNETDIRILPFFVYTSGNSFFTNDANANYPSCLPIETLDYDVEYKYVGWTNYTHEERPYPDCHIPFLGDADQYTYNQVRTTPISHVIWEAFREDDIHEYGYSCLHNFTAYGYALCQCTMQDNIYSPHCAVIYSATGAINTRVSSVTVSGNFDKAWVFDRENGQFVGPDDTPDTWFTSSPFSPTKIIDGQDLFVAIAHDDTSPTADTWTVSGVNISTVAWTGTHDQGYDVPLPDLINWEDTWDVWKDNKLADTLDVTYLPAGVKRGGIKLKKDSIKGTFMVSVQSSGAIVEALETYDITNAPLIMRRTYADLDHTDPDNTDLLVMAYVDSWELTDTELKIRAKLNFHSWGSTFPRRRASYFCPFVFKGPQCNYGGAALTCDKTLTACTALGNEAQFGGIPTLPRLQRGKWG